jgi:chemotaxis signal transduction protein
MRISFDESFASAPRLRGEGLEPLLRIRAGEEALALRSIHITGLLRIGRVLPVPSRIPELLGITGIRGTLVPVFDLAALLGLRSGGAQPRWLALTRGETPVALAFDQIDGQIEVSRANIYEHQASPSREHIKEVAHIGPAAHDVVDIPAVVETIRQRAGLISTDKE